MSGRLPRGAALVLTASECGLIALSRRAILEHWQRVGMAPAGLLDLLDECDAVALAVREARAMSASVSDSGPVLAVRAGASAGLYMSTAKAAERLGVGQRQVRRLREAGLLVGQRRDERAHWLIDASTVEAYMERRVGAA